MPILAPIGRAFLALLAATGRLALFTAAALGNAVRPPYYPRLILKQMIEIGYFSLPVVGLTAIFTGMVLALQSHSGFARFNAESAIATVVVLSVTRELGPVLAGLMVAGRIGAAMAAEIGTMRVTEQIDALTTLSTNPYKYLVAPRLIAGLTMLPLLVLATVCLLASPTGRASAAEHRSDAVLAPVKPQRLIIARGRLSASKTFSVQVRNANQRPAPEPGRARASAPTGRSRARGPADPAALAGARVAEGRRAGRRGRARASRGRAARRRRRRSQSGRRRSESRGDPP